MKYKNDKMAIILANRYFIYKLLQYIWGNEPDLKLLEILINNHTKESFKIFEDEDNTFADIQNLIKEIESLQISEQNIYLDNLRSNYTALMVGPGPLAAPPWESVYQDKERLIMQKSTLGVRREYLKYQFLPANYPHEADDHIALELDFMVHLSEAVLENFEEGNMVGAKSFLIDQKTFLEEHPLLWISEFADKVQDAAISDFYSRIAVLTKKFLIFDASLSEELILLVE